SPNASSTRASGWQRISPSSSRRSATASRWTSHPPAATRTGATEGATMTILLRASTLLLAASLCAPAPAQTASERPRAREAGVVVGVFPTGTANAITDVAGVRVGHATVRGEHGNTG